MRPDSTHNTRNLAMQGESSTASNGRQEYVTEWCGALLRCSLFALFVSKFGHFSDCSLSGRHSARCLSATSIRNQGGGRIAIGAASFDQAAKSLGMEWTHDEPTERANH